MVKPRFVFYVALLAFNACAAHVQRVRMDGYNVIVAPDASVAAHCKRGTGFSSPHHRIVPRADNGLPVDYGPRACTDFAPTRFGRKPDIFIGESYIKCALHEIGHTEHPDDPAWVEKHIPCLK